MKNIIKYMIVVIIVCTLTTSLSILLYRTGIGKENTLMIFLVGVLAITVLTKGYVYGFIASFASLMIFNYFFTEPIHSFVIIHAQDYMLIVFFLIASMITGTLSTKFQIQTQIAKSNERTSQLLYHISESFLNLSGVQSILKKGVDYIFEHSGYRCQVVLDNKLFDDSECYFSNVISLTSNSDYEIPIKAHSNQLGMLTIEDVHLPLSHKDDMLIKSVVFQMALVLDREFIYSERERIKLAMTSERLKSTLLRSISHDIRTPLTGIIGASSLILDGYETLDEASVKKLVTDINEQAAWLHNSVQNILDMTRIGEGNLILKKEFESIDDLFNQTVKHIPWLTNSNQLQVVIPDEIILVEMDGRLMVQVLVNLLDNAYKHSGNESIIRLRAHTEEDKLLIDVSDNGVGIADHIKETLFDGAIKSSREIADSSHGVGLGLNICKTVIEAHGGKINVLDNPEGGTTFRIELKIEKGEAKDESYPIN
jgi:two-component system sensor histidine kinase KdpD